MLDLKTTGGSGRGVGDMAAMSGNGGDHRRRDPEMDELRLARIRPTDLEIKVYFTTRQRGSDMANVFPHCLTVSCE